MKTPSIPEELKAFFRKTGAVGGKARANRHTPKELSEWGKMGGRPTTAGKKKTKKKGGK